MSSSARGRARPNSIAEPDVLDNLASFTRHQRAENKAPSTIVTYSKAVEQFELFLADGRRRRPRRVADVRREDIEGFLVERQEAGMRPATLSQRFRSLQQFFKWLAAEGEIEQSPMATMRPPHVPETPPPVLREADLRKLLDACAGTDFEDRRDNAMIRLFLDSGMRRGELAGLRVEDVDFDQELAVVLGKGRRPRACPFGHKTGQALDRYMRARARRPDAPEPWLWLGKRGRLTETGVEQAVKRRGRAAGLPDIHPHQFRAMRRNSGSGERAELATALPKGSWTLVGAQMVFLLAYEHDLPIGRTSGDVDLMMDVRALTSSAADRSQCCSKGEKSNFPVLLCLERS